MHSGKYLFTIFVNIYSDKYCLNVLGNILVYPKKCNSHGDLVV